MNARVGAALLALTCAAVPNEAAAQRYLYTGETEIGYFGGRLFMDDVIDADEDTPFLIDGIRIADGTGFGLRLTRNASTHWTAEAIWAYTFSELRLVTTSGQDVFHDRTGILQYGLFLMYHPVWLSDERIGPFLRVGVGGMSFRPANGFRDYERPVNTRRTASVAVFAGAGAVVYATEDLSFRGEYEAGLTDLDRDRLLGLDEPFPSIGSKSVVSHRVTLGFGLRFFDTDL